MEKLQYVYIILCNQPCLEHVKSYHQKQRGFFYKIGRCNDLNIRLAGIRTGCPFELSLFFWVRFKNRNSAIDAENEMHLRYKEKCIRGEWFFFRNGQTTQPLLKIKTFLTRLHNAVEISEQLTLYYRDKSSPQCINKKGRYFIV